MILVASTEQPNWTNVVVAVIATAAFVLSIVTLATQWILWHRSGPRVRVQLSYAFIAWGAGGTQDVLSITANNAGRAAAQVRQWWLVPVKRTRGSLAFPGTWVRDSGMNLVFPRHVQGSAELPALLEASSAVGWMVDLAPVIEIAKEHGITHVRPAVGLGSGKEIRGKVFEIRSATS